MAGYCAVWSHKFFHLGYNGIEEFKVKHNIFEVGKEFNVHTTRSVEKLCIYEELSMRWSIIVILNLKVERNEESRQQHAIERRKISV